MSSPLILVTGATGKTGSAVVSQLREKNARVRALVHRKDARSERLHALGAEVVVADMFDPVEVENAMTGVSRLYYCPPWHPFMVQSAVAFATAAHRARVEAIVGITQWLASPSHPALATRQTWLVDQLFDMVPGAAHVTVNPGFFASMPYLSMIGMAAQLGVFPMPMGKGRNAPPSDEDIARVIVGSLMDPERHAGRTYRPTGPRLLSADDIAAAMGEAVGRKVRHVDMPMWMFNKAIRVFGPRMGLDAFFQTALRHYVEEQKRGTFELGAPTTHVRDVSGVEPEEFVTIARRYAARPENRRTAGNLARALWDFMLIGMTPAMNGSRFERSQQYPTPAVPELAAQSDRWAREHLATSAVQAPDAPKIAAQAKAPAFLHAS